MRWRSYWMALFCVVLPAVTHALDTASCAGKRAWQRSIVQSAVHGWFSNDARADELMQLIQAEHGIVACAAGTALPSRLHTTTLSPGLELDQLGAVLLANELEWSGLIARPETGLAGVFFRIAPLRSSDVVSRRPAPGSGLPQKAQR